MNAFNACAKRFLALLLLVPVHAWADDATKPITAVSAGGSVTKVALALIGLLALIALLAWLANKLQKARFLTTSGHIKAISVLPLGVKEKIAVIEVGSEQLVVGVTPQQITLLSKLDTPIAPENSSTKLSGAFAKTLKKAMSNEA